MSRRHGRHEFLAPDDPSQRLFFVNAREVCATLRAWKQEHVPGERYTGGVANGLVGPTSGHTARSVRSIRRRANGAGNSSTSHRQRPGCVDGIGADLQRRRRRELPCDRCAERKVPVALSDGFCAARDIGRHLHAGRTPARARARGNDDDSLGASDVQRAEHALNKSQAQAQVTSHKILTICGFCDLSLVTCDDLTRVPY